LAARDASVRQVANGLAFPNGMLVTPDKRCVRVREGGDVLQMIQLDRGCFACALGGLDGRTLFMMATEWERPREHVRRDPDRPGRDRGSLSTAARLAVAGTVLSYGGDDQAACAAAKDRDCVPSQSA
jgi:sugar lactone lactonase YvrE